jgi:inward rectifier potassium channel
MKFNPFSRKHSAPVPAAQMIPSHFGNRNNVPKELGFGTNLTEDIRLINPDGSFNVRRVGLRVFHPYYALTTMSWVKFNLIVLAFFLLINFLFTIIYLLIGLNQIGGMEPGSSWTSRVLECFYFSCQTFTSVGYGRLNPVGLGAGMVSSIEALVGVLASALATGLLFARFSRPEAKLIFSKNALMAPYQNGRALMFKFANARSNQLIEVEVTVTLSVIVEENGKPIRRFYTLPLENSKVNLFPLSWTIVHAINPESPLRFLRSPDDLQRSGTEILVSIKAFDDSFSETVYSRFSYMADDIVWGAKFPVVFYPQDGTVVLDLSRMNEFVPADLPEEVIPEENKVADLS